MDQITPAAVQNVPMLVQEYLEPKTDYRVTIIGDELLAVKILCNGQPLSGDWRLKSKEQLDYVDCSLPEEVETGCRNLMKRLNLQFGAIDFVETESGFVFLEINPTGEWGWLNSEERCFDKIMANWLS